MAQVQKQALEQGKTPLFPAALAYYGGIAKFQQGLAAGLFRGEAQRDVFTNFPLEMLGQLLLQVFFKLPALP
jgi:hypothetical protein